MPINFQIYEQLLTVVNSISKHFHPIIGINTDRFIPAYPSIYVYIYESIKQVKVNRSKTMNISQNVNTSQPRGVGARPRLLYRPARIHEACRLRPRGHRVSIFTYLRLVTFTLL